MKRSILPTILGRAVYTETGESVGRVHDLVIAPNKTLSYAIIRAGGFIGLWRQFAIPLNQLFLHDGELMLESETRTATEALPPFEYSTGK
jgi:sporulation protein YlmC with PRC-barrel domain